MANLIFPLLLVVLLVPMFLTVRRQKREMAETTAMQAGLAVGDRVVMTSGIQGVIVEIEDTTVDLEIAVDVITTWSRAAVKEVIESAGAELADAELTDAEAADEDSVGAIGTGPVDTGLSTADADARREIESGKA